MGDQDSESDEVGSSATLSRRSRVVASVGSGVFATAGLAATFLSSNQAGTALVIAAAALFGIVGLTGHVPTKLKFGDNEITMPIVKAVVKRIEEAPREEAGGLAADVVAALPSSVQRNIPIQLAASLYEDVVALALRRAIAEAGVDYHLNRYRSDMGPFDFFLDGPKPIKVVVKYSQRGYGRMSALAYLQKLAPHLENGIIDKCLLVVNSHFE